MVFYPGGLKVPVILIFTAISHYTFGDFFGSTSFQFGQRQSIFIVREASGFFMENKATI
jgi:hypothetical protein